MIMLMDIEQVREYMERQAYWGQRPHSAAYARLETLRMISKWQQYKPIALTTAQHRAIILTLKGNADEI